MAILGFADKETEMIFDGGLSRRIPQSIQKIAFRKMLYMDSINTLNDLRQPPSNHLEALHGDREGQYSIRVNKQYRICFTVQKNGFDNVEIIDYH